MNSEVEIRVWKDLQRHMKRTTDLAGNLGSTCSASISSSEASTPP